MSMWKSIQNLPISFKSLLLHAVSFTKSCLEQETKEKQSVWVQKTKEVTRTIRQRVQQLTPLDFKKLWKAGYV